jgi:phage regulator Rha-like protein
MRKRKAISSVEPVASLIRLIRRQRVIVDADLAKVYGVTTTRLNQQVSRNAKRFPNDFAFRLTADEFAGLMLQIATSKNGRGGRRKRPLVFTEHGAIMAANVLNSPRAAQMSVFVVRAFVKMREALAQNRQLAAKLADLERRLTDRLNVHEKAIVHILDDIKKLMEPLPSAPEPKRREIGFHVRDEVGAKARTRPGSEVQAQTNPVPACSRRVLQV